MRFLFVFALLFFPARLFAAPLPDAGHDAMPAEASAAPSAPVSDAVAPSGPAVVSEPLAGPSAPASEVEIPGVVVSSSTPFPGEVAPGSLPGDDDIFGHGKEAFEAAQAARKAPTVAAIAAALVAGIMLLISLARRFGGLLLTPQQVRVFVVVASALAGGVAQVSDGMAWWQILFIALSPVMSVGVHQVFVKPLAKKRA